MVHGARMSEIFTAASVGCRKCPALCASRTNIVDGAGSRMPRLMVVAEAPGEWEDRNATPFVGESGQLIRGTLAEGGLHNKDTYVTNVVRCRPEGNRDPTEEELENCLPWLVDEVRRLEPLVILAMGRFAVRQVARAVAEAESVAVVYNITHPAAIMRSSRSREPWKETVWEATDHALGLGLRGPEPKLPPWVEPWSEGIVDLNSPWLAADTETDDLEEGYGKRLVTTQYSDGRAAFLVDRPFLYPMGVGRVEELPHVYLHNAKYDLPLLGIDPAELERWDDTGLMAYVLRYERVGLKELGPALTGIQMDPISSILKYRAQTRKVLKSKCRRCKGECVDCGEPYCEKESHTCPECEGEGHPVRYTEKWAKRSFSEALRDDPEKAREYALKDPVVTSRLARILVADLSAEPSLDRYYREIEKPTVPVIMAMEQHGALVDVGALTRLSGVLEDELALVGDGLKRYLGSGVNFFSNEQLADVLVEKGYELRDTTATGQLSVDEQVLLKLAGVTDKDDVPEGHVVWWILELRRLRKLKSTYVDRLLADRDEMSRVHTEYNQMATGTNRLASRGPNLQNIPLRGKIKKAIRSVFIAPAGAKLVKADFSQLEVRIYAHYTMEPVLLAAYPWDGPARDVHQGVADELGIARWRAKNVMFAGAYGAGGPKLAETAGVEKDKAEAFLGRMRERIPAFVIWPKHIGGLLARQGFIETWLGWRNYYPLYWSPIKKDQRKALREAANLPIQGTASGIVKMFMARMHKLCPKYEALPILQVHDEMVYEVPGGNVAAFAEMLKAIGRQIGVDIGLRVPLEVNVEAGPNWGDTSEL